MKKLFGCSISFLCLFSFSTLAGNENTLILLQDTTGAGTAGNTLLVDQSTARGSVVEGLSGNGSAAFQLGSGNTANVLLEGTGGRVQFGQDSTNTRNSGNTANLTVIGTATAGLLQDGGSNEASVLVSGLRATGVIEQTGRGNTAQLLVRGRAASGTVAQQGSGNDVTFQVTGNQTKASYTQIGNNLSHRGAGPSVVADGAQISIVQTLTQFPTVTTD